MPLIFSLEEIEKIAELASIKLSEEEKVTFSHQLDDIVNYFNMLDAVKLTESRSEDPNQKNPHFREDRANPSGTNPKDFSPYLEDGHFKVPRVIE